MTFFYSSIRQFVLITLKTLLDRENIMKPGSLQNLWELCIRNTTHRCHGDYCLLLGDFRSLYTVRHSFIHAARLRVNTSGGTCISTWCIPFQLWSCQQGVVVHLVRSSFCKDSKTKITLCLVWALIILTEGEMAFFFPCMLSGTPVLIRFS